MPDTFVWVITTPKEPDAYAVADPLLFEDMFALAEALVVPVNKSMARSKETDSPQAAGVELGKRVQVGPYDIQPVRGVGPHALTGLNLWLKDNGFPTETPDHMTYFVTNNFTFLCVKVTAKEKNQSVEPNGMLPPLHLSFETPVPYYPLRFSSRQGVFDVTLHVLTRSKLDYKKSDQTLTKLNWSSQNYKQNVKLPERQMPATLRKVFGMSAWKDDVNTWWYNNIRCSRVNSRHPISDWKEDVFLSVQ